MDSAVASQVPVAGASTSSVLSLLTGYHNQMSGVAITGPPSFGASSPRRALDGGRRRSDVPSLVLPSARRKVVVSCDVLVRLLLPTLSPHSVGKPSQFVGGWPQNGVAATGVVVALWLWGTWQASISAVAPSEDHHSPLRVCNLFTSLLVLLWILLLLHKYQLLAPLLCRCSPC